MSDETDKPELRPHSGGKPPVAITPAELENLARLNCTVAEAASFFKCSKRTLQRDLADPEFKKAWDQGRKFGRMSLRRLQWKDVQGTGSSAV